MWIHCHVLTWLGLGLGLDLSRWHEGESTCLLSAQMFVSDSTTRFDDDTDSADTLSCRPLVYVNMLFSRASDLYLFWQQDYVASDLGRSIYHRSIWYVSFRLRLKWFNETKLFFFEWLILSKEYWRKFLSTLNHEQSYYLCVNVTPETTFIIESGSGKQLTASFCLREEVVQTDMTRDCLWLLLMHVWKCCVSVKLDSFMFRFNIYLGWFG